MIFFLFLLLSNWILLFLEVEAGCNLTGCLQQPPLGDKKLLQDQGVWKKAMDRKVSSQLHLLKDNDVSSERTSLTDLYFVFMNQSKMTFKHSTSNLIRFPSLHSTSPAGTQHNESFLRKASLGSFPRHPRGSEVHRTHPEHTHLLLLFSHRDTSAPKTCTELPFPASFQLKREQIVTGTI